MLRYAFRRLLWVFPSVIGVSLITFYLLSLMPAGGERPPSEDEQRRVYSDLPLFFNVDPRDVRTRATEAMEEAVADGDREAQAHGATELLRLGGAALPVILPQLDQLAPDRRVRVALALAGLADRMGIEHAGAARDPERVVVFWNRFWAARGVEFREGTARSAVRRYAHYGTEARADQLRVLDTFALPYLFEALEPPTDAAALREASRIVRMIAHVTGNDDRFGEQASLADAGACIQRWRRWWMVYENDFLRLSGADRVAAFAVQTRYGKWAFEAVAMRLGLDAEGKPLLDDLMARMRITFTILCLGIALAYLLAVPLGALAAAKRGRVIDHAVSAAVLTAYAASPALLGALALRFGAGAAGEITWAVALLALAILAEPTRQQRAELLPILAADYVRAAVARGAGRWRAVVVHGLRNALLPVVTRAGVELPLALTACFVLEATLGLRGLGDATIHAVVHRDHRWLMALSVAGAVWAVMSLVLADIAYATLDPRLRQALAPARGRQA